MSRKKDNTKTEEKVAPEASLPEDKPGEVNMSPEVKNTSGDSSTLKRGIEMEKIDSPRYGVPGQAIATRAAAGGGAWNPSAQVDRSPTNPTVRGAGSDPLNKMDIRDELAWNEMGAEQFRTIIEGSPAGFAPDSILGNFVFEDNLAFQFDNSGEGPGILNEPYRRRVTVLSKDQLVYVNGQHDAASKSAMVSYPTQSYVRNQARQVASIVNPAVRGNYLMRGMTVNVKYTGSGYALDSVSFDTVSLPVESSPADLDVRYDNGRIQWDIADRDITETYFNLVNKAENLQANKYSPLPDGQPQAIQHLILSRDVAQTDGLIALLAARSVMETYALHRKLRTVYGSGNGATAQTRSMMQERMYPVDGSNVIKLGDVWADNANIAGAETVGAHNDDFIRLSMSEYIQTFLDSPTKYNSNFGVWVTQPRGVRMLFEQMQKSFDTCGFMIDKDTYALVDQLLGWHDEKGIMMGVDRMGIIAPVDYNALYEKTDGVIKADASGEIHSRYIYCDYVLNGSMFNQTEVRSPLVDAILRVIKYRFTPKLKNQSENYTYTFYIPFDFACDHYSFGHAILMEAFAHLHEYLHPARAVFDRFEQQYGTNPLMSDLTQELRLADVMKSSSYKGIGADPVMQPMSAGLRLMLEVPESYQISATTWDNALERPDALVGIKFTDLAPLSDDISEAQKLLFPMLYKTECLEQWKMIKDMGAEKLLRSRDFPIHRYQMGLESFSPVKGGGSAPYDGRTPFFELQVPKAYHAESINGCQMGLFVDDILKAPRINGRITPAPIGMLDFVRMPTGAKYDDSHTISSVSDIPTGSFMELRLDNRRNGSSTTFYGWKYGPEDAVIFIAEANKKLQITGYDIDNYRVQFVFAPEYEQTTLGLMLHRYCVHFSTGALPVSDLYALESEYGMYFNHNDVDVRGVFGSVSVADNEVTSTIAAGGTLVVGSSYTKIKVGSDTTKYSLISTDADYVANTYADITVSVGSAPLKRKTISNAGAAGVDVVVLGNVHSVDMEYQTNPYSMWVYDNVLPFITSPFTGNISELLTKGDSYVSCDYELNEALKFGLAGFQGLWYDRLNNEVYAAKQAVGGRVFDNSLLHKSNIMFE